MIAGLIEGHLGASKYSVRISYDVTKANILIDWYGTTIIERKAQKEQAIVELNAAIANEVEDLLYVEYKLKTYINLLSSEILQLEKSTEFVEKHKGGEKVVTAYSNLYDESLTGIVAVELIGGIIDSPVIIVGQPIDRRVTMAVNMGKEHCFSNFALMSGWLKWAQRYSFARIDTAGSTATGTMATLNNKLSLIGGIVPFDKESISAADDYGYELGDLALVEFDSAGNQAYNGWYKNPRNLFNGWCTLFRTILEDGRMIWRLVNLQSHEVVISYDPAIDTLPAPYDTYPYTDSENFLEWLKTIYDGSVLSHARPYVEIAGKLITSVWRDKGTRALTLTYTENGVSGLTHTTYWSPIFATYGEEITDSNPAHPDDWFESPFFYQLEESQNSIFVKVWEFISPDGVLRQISADLELDENLDIYFQSGAGEPKFQSAGRRNEWLKYPE